MRSPRLPFVFGLMLALTGPLHSQSPEGLTNDLLRDVQQVRKKILGLANALPEKSYEWRPGRGVRSTGEVLSHIAADNYFIPAAMGMNAPPETGIDGKSFDSALAFEKKITGRAQIIAEVDKSFAFLEESIKKIPDEKLEMPLDMGGQKITNRRMLILAVTHLHEHLGQLIAYARSNNVTPPWSK